MLFFNEKLQNVSYFLPSFPFSDWLFLYAAITGKQLLNTKHAKSFYIQDEGGGISENYSPPTIRQPTTGPDSFQNNLASFI